MQIAQVGIEFYGKNYLEADEIVKTMKLEKEKELTNNDWELEIIDPTIIIEEELKELIKKEIIIDKDTFLKRDEFVIFAESKDDSGYLQYYVSPKDKNLEDKYYNQLISAKKVNGEWVVYLPGTKKHLSETE